MPYIRQTFLDITIDILGIAQRNLLPPSTLGMNLNFFFPGAICWEAAVKQT